MIKVLIVDDSALIRRIIRDALLQNPDIEVVDTAENGAEAIEKLKELNPDVITLDVEMPVMNGLETLKKIISIKPTPVIMVSALTTKEASVTVEALMSGAVDFIAKPKNLFSDFDSFVKELQSKVVNVAKSKGRYAPIIESLSGISKTRGICPRNFLLLVPALEVPRLYIK